MPEYYTWRKYSGAEKIAFTSDDTPAGILIYLGTNDYSNPTPDLDQLFTAGLLDFMANATRVWYGTPAAPAKIAFFLVLGPMSPTRPAAAIQAAVSQGTTAGYKVVLVNASAACGAELRGCTDGCAGHPGVAGHWSIAMTALPLVRAALSL
jgi:hypothetical protein